MKRHSSGSDNGGYVPNFVRFEAVAQECELILRLALPRAMTHPTNFNGASARLCAPVPCAACVMCVPFLDTKVTMRAGGVDGKVNVTVGSPRYIMETIFLDATHGDDDADPVTRWITSSAEDVAEQAEGDREGASGGLSVRI